MSLTAEEKDTAIVMLTLKYGGINGATIAYLSDAVGRITFSKAEYAVIAEYCSNQLDELHGRYQKQ